MALSVTHVQTALDTTNVSSYALGVAVEMLAGVLYLVAVESNDTSPVVPTTVASASVSFTKLTDAGQDTGWVSIWGAIPGSTVTEVITADWAGNGQSNCGYSINKVTGGVVSSLAAAWRNPASNTPVAGTSNTITMGAFADAANRAFAAFEKSAGAGEDTDVTAGGSFAVLGQADAASESHIDTIWRSDAADTGPSISWSGNATSAGVAIELIAADTDDGLRHTPTRRGTYRGSRRTA